MFERGASKSAALDGPTPVHRWFQLVVTRVLGPYGLFALGANGASPEGRSQWLQPRVQGLPAGPPQALCYHPRMRCKTLASLAIALCTAGFLSPLRADETSEARAKGLYHDSKRAFDEGNYLRAIELLEAANELSPNPALHFNLARAHHEAGHVDEAIAEYERFLASAPEGQGAEEARDFLAELQSLRAAAAPPATPAVASPPERSGPAPRPQPQPEQGRGVWTSIAWSAAASATLLSVGATYYAYSSWKSAQDLESWEDKWPSDLGQRIERGERGQRMAWWLGASAGAAALASALAFALRPAQAKRAAVSIGPGASSVALSWRW